ncbi:RnfABCDGE type electron transport complex subunit G [Clostridium tagluense]|uniref:RnfABCDGE type electron transport complex subunit G n=1 Tax=Clostridium TaxID=1485 RepID=UPI0013E922D3|nr:MULTISPECIES: RnfABCDGE type electron transport complex subunit G [Clostridium]MBU3128248.1 RnfABCDGE type electron transport complex subunit G [Clostridium tagluense]MBW9157867.1 RnfABCDGE type electron transport complex subunit G [Clostridium tagluense]MBZ9622773.1 RnfABCDGE type electron transport complex subunit G [Clostridium sp. FP2]MCB2296464.1 RnfABCDGE type electron transport complex subunit G [Clostridium tagluense]MCB2310740.1 RnfABCDGE type electron transport complex subunit G [
MSDENNVEHKVLHNKEYSIFQIAINLTVACFISGAIIAGTYFITAPVAAKNAITMKNDAMKALVKDAETFKPLNGKKDWFTAEKNGKVIAYVVPAESKGYGGAIKMLVSVTPQGKIIDFAILSSNETPGLGDNAGKDAFRSEFKGKKSEDLEVVKDKSKENNIQAMTGATISSKAVTKGIKEAVQQVTQLVGGK